MKNLYPYSSREAYFIAAGQSLQIILDYERDAQDPRSLVTDIEREFGGTFVHPQPIWTSMAGGWTFFFNQTVQNDALKLLSTTDGFCYGPNSDTQAGCTLKERLEANLFNGLDRYVFAKRMTGQQMTDFNPDNIKEFGSNTNGPAARYERFGDAYIICIPIVVTAVYEPGGSKKPIGIECNWFVPPDSEQIPYSTYLGLKEREWGDQLKPGTFIDRHEQAEAQRFSAWQARQQKNPKLP